MQEFAEKGFAAARIDDIAKRSKANKQLIYYYFNSKSGLYDAVLELMIETYRPQWDTLRDVTLESMVNKRGNAGPHGDETWRRLLVWEGIEHWGRRGEQIHLEERRTHAYRIQTEVIERAQQSGEFPRDIDASIASLLIFFAALGPDAFPQVTKMVTGFEADDPRLRNAITETLLHYLRDVRAAGDSAP